MAKILFIFMGFLCLTGCHLFSPVPYQPHYSYELNALPPIDRAHFKKENIFVPSVRAVPQLETNAMLYTVCPYEVRKFVYHNWVAPPASMIQNLLLQTLARQKFCVISASAVHTNVKLEVELLTLQQEFCGCHSQIHLRALVKLINYQTAVCLSTHIFDVKVPTAQPTPYCGVIAANQAVKRLLAEIVRQSLNYS